MPPASNVAWMDTAVTFPEVLYERQCISPGEMYVQAFTALPPYTVKYKLLEGEWPPGLTLNENTGQIYGIIDDNSVSAPGKVNVPPAGFRYNESNYLQYHTSGVALNFTIRAYNTLLPSVYSDNDITMYVRTNWSSKRDQMVLNINNQFYVDGVPATNESYLNTQKSRGYFPGPGCEGNQ